MKIAFAEGARARAGDLFGWFLEILDIPKNLVAEIPIPGEFSEADKEKVLVRLKALGYVG